MAEREPWRRFLREPGLWVQIVETSPAWRRRPALFLDRDGTINIDTGYPGDPAEIVLIEDVLPLMRAANAADVPAIIVTNQSGVGRGYFGWDVFARVNERLLGLLEGEGCRIAAVLACAYHAEGVEPYRMKAHPMRKPAPGMLLLAAEMLGVDLSRSIMLGDKADDVEAGRRAGTAMSCRMGHDADLAALGEAILDMRRRG